MSIILQFRYFGGKVSEKFSIGHFSYLFLEIIKHLAHRADRPRVSRHPNG